MKFTKMQGCGNDYIYINGFEEQVADERKPELARKLSDRHFGIGGDGVIFIKTKKSSPKGSDYFYLVRAVGLEPTLFRTCPLNMRVCHSATPA